MVPTHSIRNTLLLLTAILPSIGCAAQMRVSAAPAAGAVVATTDSLVVRERANASRGAAKDPADDENIRVAAGSNVRGEPGESAPAEKAENGAMTRGSNSCKVHYDNRTSLHIATYAEGIFRGDVAPWGDLYTYVIGGQTRIYARAGFTDGSVSTWGPRLVECPPGREFQWMLYN
jgi:hypothetical protein